MSGIDYPGGPTDDVDKLPGHVQPEHGPSVGHPSVAPMIYPPISSAYPPSDVQPMQPAWPGYSAYPSMAAQPPPQYQAPPGQPFLQYGQQVPQQTALVAPNGQIMIPQSFIGQVAFSCFVMWCCNFVFGLVGFILAMVGSDKAVYDPATARRLGVASYSVSGAGIFVTLVIVGIIVGLAVAGISKTTSCPYYRNNNCYSYKSCYMSSFSCATYPDSYYGYYTDFCCYRN